MFGYSAMGSCTIATRPMITMRMEITMATTGRLMKNLAMVQAYFGALVSDGALDASRTFCPARTRSTPSTITRSPGLSLRDDPERADARIDLHRAHVNSLVRPDHRNLVDPLHVLNSPLGDHEGVLLHLDDGPNLRVLAGAQHVSRIREHTAREHGAGRHVDLPIQGGGPPPCGIDGPVGQDQLQLDVPGRARIGVPSAKYGEGPLLADGELRVDGIDL